MKTLTKKKKCVRLNLSRLHAPSLMYLFNFLFYVIREARERNIVSCIIFFFKNAFPTTDAAALIQ